MRRATILSAVVFAVAMIAIAAPHHGPETVTIDAAQSKKGAVTFPHQLHWKIADSCSTCHHTQPDLKEGGSEAVKPCSSCHLDPSGDVPSMRQMSMSKNPFHMLCIDCHRAKKKEGADKTGPTTCSGCHAS